MDKVENLDNLWNHYDQGKIFRNNFYKLPTYKIRIIFNKYPKDSPLFNHDVIYKTMKSLFHDLKKECLPEDQYKEKGPLYLYKIDRGSGIWEFLAEQYPGLLLVFTLGSAWLSWQKFESDLVDRQQKALEVVDKHFPNAPKEYKNAYVSAWNFVARHKALRRLQDERLESVAIATFPHTIETADQEDGMIDIIEEIKKNIGNDERQ